MRDSHPEDGLEQKRRELQKEDCPNKQEGRGKSGQAPEVRGGHDGGSTSHPFGKQNAKFVRGNIPWDKKRGVVRERQRRKGYEPSKDRRGDNLTEAYKTKIYFNIIPELSDPSYSKPNYRVQKTAIGREGKGGESVQLVLRSKQWKLLHKFWMRQKYRMSYKKKRRMRKKRRKEVRDLDDSDNPE